MSFTKEENPIYKRREMAQAIIDRDIAFGNDFAIELEKFLDTNFPIITKLAEKDASGKTIHLVRKVEKVKEVEQPKVIQN
jgi:hypothetical protein